MKPLVACISALLTFGTVAPVIHAAPACQFVMGFKQLHDAEPAVVGDCLGNEVDAPNHAEQHTTTGLLVWQGSSDGPRFTDGYRTWIYRDGIGVSVRLNTDRFPWESTPPPAPPAATPSVCVAGSCYDADAAFQTPLQDIARTSDGLPVIQHTSGVKLHFQAVVPSGEGGAYDQTTDTITLPASLPAEGEFETAATLAHELTHAWQKRLGLLQRGQQCYTDEGDAYFMEGAVWRELWGGNLPPVSNDTIYAFNVMAGGRPSQSWLTQHYSAECG